MTTFVFERDIGLVVAGVPVTTSIREFVPDARDDSWDDTADASEELGDMVVVSQNFCENDGIRYNWRKGCWFRNSHGSRGRKYLKSRHLPGAQKRTLH